MVARPCDYSGNKSVYAASTLVYKHEVEVEQSSTLFLYIYIIKYELQLTELESLHFLLDTVKREYSKRL